MVLNKTKKKGLDIKPSLRPWYRWHRRLGAFSAILVVILSVTGLLLSHNVFLKLNKTFLTQEWLLNWYGYDAEADYANEILTLDKVVLDIHTGRFFGSAGEWLMDIAAIALLLLSASGLYMWYRKPERKKKKKKAKSKQDD